MVEMSKKVSIIIPVYNGSNYLKDAIDSALNQTYSNLEVIVVNDGSCDGGKTRDVALSYGDKIKYFEKENGGVSTALNFGIEKMTGEYFSWLSHDDMYYPNKIEKEVLELEKYDDKTILYSDFDLIDKNGKKMSTVHLDHDMLVKKPDYAIFRGAIGGITLLIPKKAFDEFGDFDTSLRCVQDYDMWARFLEKYTFVHLTDVLSMTRIHGMQDSNTSPRVLEEGNTLWKRLVFDYPKKKMVEYEGSEYLFLREMADYLCNLSPYKEAGEEIVKASLEFMEKERKQLDKKSVTVVILDNGNKDDVKKTYDSLLKQTFKNVEVFIEGNSKLPKVFNSTDRLSSLKKIKTDFYSFVYAGLSVKEDWLSNQLLALVCSKKALAISDFNRLNKDSLTDKFDVLSSISINGIIFNNSYDVKYKNDILYCYDFIKIGGSIVSTDKYFEGVLSFDKYKNRVDYLKIIINSGEYTDYDLASACYDIACSYNDNRKSGKKVYMYHNCDKYEEMSNSRSFRLFEKYINFKNKIRKR